MRIIRAAEHRLAPWKNGGGMTREVLVEPDPDDPAQFLWRISIGTVARAAPFSRFPGIDRSIAVLDGDGMRLLVDGAAVDLRPDSAPFRFSGDLEVHSDLIDGETTDLNAMTRRGAFTHEMRRLHCEGPTALQGEAASNLLVFNGRASICGGSIATDVDRLGALVGITRGDRIQIHAEAPCEMIVVALEPESVRDGRS